MNIQIFGTKKSSDTRKAERWFKERRVKAQSIDILDKGISKGELRSVAQACGGLDALLDDACRDQTALALVRYTGASQKEDAVLEHPQVLRLPIVRNGKKAAVGYCPEIYASWQAEDGK